MIQNIQILSFNIKIYIFFIFRPVKMEKSNVPVEGEVRMWVSIDRLDKLALKENVDERKVYSDSLLVGNAVWYSDKA